MNGCEICDKENRKTNNIFDTVAKTYYKLEDNSVLCYRHWHQQNKPKPIEKGEYRDIFQKSKLKKTKTT